MRVLLVDDDKLARLGIKSMLPWAKYGMEVVGEAQNGQSALDFIIAHPVDIAFVDLDMPIMDGMTFIEQAREACPSMLFVILTFYESFSLVQKALRLGAIDYISKLEIENIDPDEALRRIHARLETVQGDDGVPAEQWQIFMAEWNDMFWLYDRTRCMELLGQLTEMDANLRNIEKLATRIALLSAEHTGFHDIEAASPQKDESFDEWLSAFRSDLLNRLETMPPPISTPGAVAKILVYALEHLSEPLRTEDMAQKVNMSRSHFSMVFRKTTGLTFSEIVNRARMDAARQLLENTDLPIWDIAERVGYDDPNYFSQVFQKSTGMTPRAYRKST